MTKKLYSVICAVIGLFAVGTFSLSAQSVAEPSTLIVPPELANSFGSSAVAWNFTDALQFIYGASLFKGAAVDQLTITGVSFRIDESAQGSFDIVIPSMKMYLGVYKGPITANNNFYASEKTLVVYDHQNVRLQGQIGLAFNANFLFDQPYTYNRTDGHLLIGVGLPSGASGSFGFDAQPSSEGLFLYRDIFSVSSVPVAVGASFSYLVPEPSAGLVLLLGLVFFICVVRRRST